MLDLKRVLASAPRKPEKVKLQPLFTPWGERLMASDEQGNRLACAEDDGGKEAGSAQASPHPHPQFAREKFAMLDGWWDYAIVAADAATTDTTKAGTRPDVRGKEPEPDEDGKEPVPCAEPVAAVWQDAPIPQTWDGRIRVPFSPEAPLSGVGRQLQPHELLWYRRTIACGKPADEERRILHFEAVDYACACYVNRIHVGEHVGGYVPFSFDVTDALIDGENEIMLCVFDPSDEGVQLRGKQRLLRGGIWYTAQSGIWQSTWIETVPETRIESLAIDPQPDEGRLALDVGIRGNAASRATLTVRLFDGGEEVAQASRVPDDKDSCELALEVPKPHLWSPDDPHLYDLELTFGRDRVISYCAFRSVGVEPDAHGVPRFCLNHTPLFLRGVLDQGYWPDGLMTAPHDEALAYDVRAMRDLGFNLLRKHIKVESDRFYYWCDKLGMLVWQDMVSGGATPNPWHASYKPTFFRTSWGRYADDNPRHFPSLAAESAAFREEWTKTCEETVRYLGNHPCVVAWVLFNEAWGQFEARRAVQAVRALDPMRPVDATSGWYDQRCGDFLSVHNYFRPLEVYPDTAQPPRAFVISEFGGLSYHLSTHSSLSTSYGYATCPDLPSFQAAVRETLGQADALEAKGLAGYVYTQLSDIEEETNGLLTYDRRVNKLAKGGVS